ncbi:amidase domain-containing protein [Paenibacillus alkalitolerans]|uniref:amidase domain-containing protein n=1 Tax=Paenibacillus alkalitolerans TaxID=2799335 RepID=UPI0018F6519E|nr:amidase domain-containing protein [Paenibacillus alkalitolerans]
MDWKQILYEYVRAANERETSFSAVLDERLIADQRHRQLERKRQNRLWSWFEQRGAKPLESETKLTVRERRESEKSVVADIDMRKTIKLRTGRRIHTEERLERERLTLENLGDRWTITRVEPVTPELYGTGVASADAEDKAANGRGAFRSVPYLNERVLVRPYPDGWERAYLYDRDAAKAYADRHWNDPSPNFITFDVDCTNYVSQCLYAGGAPMNYTDRRETGWWYKGKSGGKELWSYSWSVAHALFWYLMNNRSGLRAELVTTPQELKVGDVIIYDFDGDGKFQHSTIVTGADGTGMPLVNARTSNSKARYWDYQDSYAWTERTQYRFFRIQDTF